MSGYLGGHGAAHKARPELKARHPVHVTLRVVRAVGNLKISPSA